MANNPYGFSSYDPNQLEWIAAINGKTPDQFINDGYTAQYGTPAQQWYTQQSSPTALPNAIFGAQQADDAYVKAEQARLGNYASSLGGIYGDEVAIEQGARQRADDIRNINTNLAGQSWNSAMSSNALQNQGLAGLQTAVGNAGAWDMANYGNLHAAATAPMQMTASPYVGDAMSDPADVARQLGVYNQLQGVANGSLDNVSQAAQAYADSGDIANQRNAAWRLEDAGNGALDVHLSDIPELDKLRDPDTIEGMGDLMNVYKGAQDIHVGQEDPAAYASAVEARDKLRGLTDPQVTAQEKLAYAIAQHDQEQSEGATRQALESDAARRGLGGIGTTIARSALGAQQTSYNRMMQDMQANALAVARSMDALQGYGTLSTNMTAQANQIAAQNQATRVGALSQYTSTAAGAANVLGQIGANNATNNANRQLAAQEAAYQAYATLRAQGFSEEYARGVAADNMANANSDRRLNGMVASGNIATNMRNASDAMSMYNQGQRQQQSQFADSYAANRQDAQFNRAVQDFNGANTVGRNYMQDQGTLFNGITTTAIGNDARVQGSIGVQQGLNNQWLGAGQFADGVGQAGVNIRTGILDKQNGAISQSNGLPVISARQKVADATQIRNINTTNANDADYRTAIGGGPGGSANGAPIIANPGTAGGGVYPYGPNDPRNPAFAVNF